MADTKITALTALTGANSATTDLYLIVDVSVPETKKQTRAELFQNTPPISVSGTFSTSGNAAFNSGNAEVTGTAINANMYLTCTTGKRWLITSDTTSNLNFYDSTSGNLRGRFDTNGYLLVGYGTSNGAYKLQVNSQIFATSATVATSDGRYKENVKPLTGAMALVSKLNPVQFTWKEHPVHAFDRAAPTIGFIAQEVQEALAGEPYLPSIVKDNVCTYVTAEGEEKTEDFLGIAEGNMIPLLTKALQEAMTEIAALRARVEALEAK